MLDLDLESVHQLDVNLVDEVLALTRNIHQTYLDAPYHFKRHYLRFFFERLYVKDKKIAKVIETPTFSTLRKQHLLILRTNWLPNPEIIIATVEKLLRAFENLSLTGWNYLLFFSG